ncbi:hypothetical protein [Chryseobacterium sp. FH1]|uniref:hypothetical protein n=1 Tax=Chryseobacterium sp. FH1 TaxID=1233951 RepID=UPI000A70AFD4|nr:hypothetical protein [Chryseobacterium sp. FH1]
MIRIDPIKFIINELISSDFGDSTSAKPVINRKIPKPIFVSKDVARTSRIPNKNSPPIFLKILLFFIN